MKVRIEGIQKDELYLGKKLISLLGEVGLTVDDYPARRYYELMWLAGRADLKGYDKAARLLVRVAARYYS